MTKTKSVNFMSDRPWPGLTTTALSADVSQGRSDKYATETQMGVGLATPPHKTNSNAKETLMEFFAGIGEAN